MKWVVVLHAVLHCPEPWKIYNKHDSVMTGTVFFKTLTRYFYLKLLLPHTYNDSHSLVICLLMLVVPAYMGLGQCVNSWHQNHAVTVH